MVLYTLASSSRGNCALVSHNNCHILVDAGISMRRITAALKALGLSPAELAAILVTHGHTDHVSGLPMLVSHFSLPVFAAHGTAQALAARWPELYPHLHGFAPASAFSIGDFSIESFPTSHDAADSTGYCLSAGGRRFAFVTDLGQVTAAVLDCVSGADGVLLEANHDEKMLLSGPYPYPLKRRILGEYGHLSNADGGALAVRLARSGTRHIILAHLSRENNAPELALETVSGCLRAAGLFPGRDLTLSVAPKDETGKACIL